MCVWNCGRMAALLAVMAALSMLAGCVTENSRSDGMLDEPPSESRGDQPPSASTMHALSKILATQGRDNECERVLLQIIQREPDYVPAYSDLAELHLRHNRPDEAQQCLAAGLSRSRQDPVLLNNMGMCHVLKEDHAAALALFTQATAVAPRNPTYLANKAMALGMLDRFDEAAIIYKQILPDPESVQHNLAILRQARSRLNAVGNVEPPTTLPDR